MRKQKAIIYSINVTILFVIVEYQTIIVKTIFRSDSA